MTDEKYVGMGEYCVANSPTILTALGLGSCIGCVIYDESESKAVMGQQKFRPAFGPIPWRMLLAPNSVKILFIGQSQPEVV